VFKAIGAISCCFLFKCAIPVFEGLLPEPHNERLMDLLFMMAYWHGMAKLRLHSEPTLETMDRLTTSLGDKFRAFEKHTCSAFVTYELKKEATARERRQSKSAKKPDTSKRLSKVSGTSKESPRKLEDTSKDPRRLKTLNLNTYKFHAIGDVVATIRRYGTTDSYSTESVGFLPASACRSLSLTSGYMTGRIGASNTEIEIRQNK
jgi:hypothetical protein